MILFSCHFFHLLRVTNFSNLTLDEAFGVVVGVRVEMRVAELADDVARCEGEKVFVTAQ